MRDRLLHHRSLIAVVVAAIALASPWAASARADVAQVTVVSAGGSQQTLALEALAGGEDVIDRSYVIRGGEGETTQVVTGFSLAKLLEAAGADIYSFSFLEVQRPAGGAVLLSRHQALDPAAFADGPPVVYVAAGGTGFLRPSGGEEDANAGDSFTAPQGISIVLRKGSQLRVRAKASPVRTPPGRPVHFEAIVKRAGSGASLTYSWYFDDGGAATSASATHSFAKPGSYDVVVGVTANGDETGASDVVHVQVGAPPKGPDRKGGGRNEAKNAPDHGSVEGPSEGSGGGGDTAGSGAAPTTGMPPSPETSAATSPAKSRFESPPRGDKGTTRSETGEEVEGELLAAGAGVPAAQGQAQVAARRGQVEGDGGSVPAAAWGVLATLGLLGAGVLAEAGQLSAALGRRLPWRRGTA